MAPAVVDQLEAVEVDEEHRHLGAGPGRPGQGLAEAFGHQHPVGEPGEGVMDGLVGQLELCLLALAHVAYGRRDQHALLGPQRREADLDRELAAVGPAGVEVEFGPHGPGVEVGGVPPPVEGVAILEPVGEEELDGLADELVATPAEQLLRLAVDEDDAPVAVGDHDAVWCRLEQIPELLFLLLEHLGPVVDQRHGVAPPAQQHLHQGGDQQGGDEPVTEEQPWSLAGQRAHQRPVRRHDDQPALGAELHGVVHRAPRDGQGPGGQHDLIGLGPGAGVQHRLDLAERLRGGEPAALTGRGQDGLAVDHRAARSGVDPQGPADPALAGRSREDGGDGDPVAVSRPADHGGRLHAQLLARREARPPGGDHHEAAGLFPDQGHRAGSGGDGGVPSGRRAEHVRVAVGGVGHGGQ